MTVRVVPRASRSALAGIDAEGRVRVRLTAPPVEGKANRALVRFLADALGVPRARVSIAGGAASRTKVVEVAGMSDADLKKRLEDAQEKRLEDAQKKRLEDAQE